MTKHTTLTVFFLFGISLFATSQEIQSISVAPASQRSKSMGVVNPFEGLGGVTSAYNLVADFQHTDSAIYTIHEINFGGVLQVTNSFDIGAQLPRNHYLLHQVVKDNRWFVFGYEKTAADSVRYFLSTIEFDGNNTNLKFPLQYHSKVFNESVEKIVNANILNENEIAFIGNRKNIGKTTQKGLVILYNTADQSWRRLEINNDDSTSGKSVYTMNAFLANDSLYVLEGINDEIAGKSDALSVYDSNYEFKGLRPIPESISEPGNNDFKFDLDLGYVQWGEGFVFSGRSTYGNRGTASDFYFQEYDAEFNMVFDERYYNVPRETMPFQQSFYHLTDNFGVMVSQEFGFFGSPGNRNLYLRLYDRNTTTTTLQTLRDEEFSHFVDGIVVNMKMLLVGFYTEDSPSRTSEIRYYVADYSNTVVGINENNYEASQLTIYPNPIKSGTSVNIGWSGMKHGKLDVSIVSSTGSLVDQQTLSQSNGNVIIKLPELPSGIYTIHLQGTDDQVHSGTLVVH